MLRPGTKVVLEMEIVAHPEDPEQWGLEIKDPPGLDDMDMFQLWVFMAYRLHDMDGIPSDAQWMMRGVMSAFEAIAMFNRLGKKARE